MSYIRSFFCDRLPLDGEYIVDLFLQYFSIIFYDIHSLYSLTSLNMFLLIKNKSNSTMNIDRI